MLMLLLKVLSTGLGIVILIVDQCRNRKHATNRLLFWLAICFLVFSVATTTTDHLQSTKYDQEREADLKLIQKLISSVDDLCFELQLSDTVSNNYFQQTLQILLSVRTISSRSGMFADYMHIKFFPDSGWVGGHSQYKRYDDVRTKRVGNKVRFALPEFGLSANRVDERYGWQPTNVSDLGRLTVEMMIISELIFLSEPDSTQEWCPIDKIVLYINSFDSENVIALLVPEPDTSARTRTYIKPSTSFFPENHPDLHIPNAWSFQLDPLQLRESILACD